MKLFKKRKIGIDFILLEIGTGVNDDKYCGGYDLWMEIFQGNNYCETIQ